MEPPPGFEPGSRPYQERALPSELRRPGWGMRIRTSTARHQKPADCLLSDSPEPFPRVELDRHPYKGRVDTGPKGIVSSARFELALPTTSPSCLLPLGLRGLGAATRCRPGPPALRGRGHKPCATAQQLGNQDSNLDRQLQRLPCCQLHHSPSSTGGGIRTRTPRGLSSRGLPVASLPRAPPGIR